PVRSSPSPCIILPPPRSPLLPYTTLFRSAQALVHHVAHLLPTSWCVHHFFRRTSLMTSFSSTCSASSFFNRPFSASSSFRRLASDRKSTRLNSSHVKSSYAVFCLK